MSELQIFKNEQFGEVRTVELDGEPWFLGKDIAKALGYADINKAVAMHVDECDRKALRRKDYDKTCVTFWDSDNDLKNKIVINESGVYSLIMESNLESAKAFKRWITHEVIPSIRKHGAYATPDTLERMLNDPDSMIKVLTALKEEREQRKALESKAAADKPKVMFAEAVTAAAGSIGIGDMAKILKKNGVDIGRTRLFTWLRNNGYLMQSGNNTVPTQKAMDMGLFEITETVIQSPDKEPFVRLTTKVTGKGQEYFLRKIKDGERNIPPAR